MKVFKRGALIRHLLLSIATMAAGAGQPVHSKSVGPFGNGRGISVAALGAVDYPSLAGPFAYHTAGSPTASHDVDRSSPTLLRNLRAAGFGFARLVTSPLPLTQQGMQKAAAFSTIIKTVHAFRAAGLRVIVDFHFWSPGPYNQDDMLDDPAKRAAFAKAEVALAERLKRSPGVALELLNEPKGCPVGSKIDWRSFQQQLVQDIRAIAPRLPLILAGCVGQVDGLLALDASPYARDPQIYYTFHFYEPFIFTHQNTYYGLRDVPFPPRIGSNAPIGSLAMSKYLTTKSRVDAEDSLRNYFSDPQPSTNMARRINAVGAWAVRYKVSPTHILLGEFGSTLNFREGSIPMRVDYLRWVATVRQLAAARGFSWSYWSSDGDFDLPNKRLQLDIRRALGLDPESQGGTSDERSSDGGHADRQPQVFR